MNRTQPATGLEFWRDAAAGPITDPAAIDRMAANSRLDAALRLVVSESLAFFRSNSRFNHQFLDLGTFILGWLAIYLDVTGGLTHRRLAALCGSSKLLSNGRASAILLRLWTKGFLRRADRPGQGRTVLYGVTPELMNAYRDRLRAEIAGMAILEPAAAALLARWDEPGVFQNYLALFGKDLIHAALTPPEKVDVFNRISAYRASMLILYTLMEAADDGGAFPPSGDAPVSISALASVFQVSRSHVRRVLDLWEQASFIRRSDEEGLVRLLPALHDSLKRYFAIIFIAGLRYAHFVLSSHADRGEAELTALPAHYATGEGDRPADPA